MASWSLLMKVVHELTSRGAPRSAVQTRANSRGTRHHDRMRHVEKAECNRSLFATLEGGCRSRFSHWSVVRRTVSRIDPRYGAAIVPDQRRLSAKPTGGAFAV